MEKVIQFFKEVKAELIKVSWPTKKETTQYTLVVIAMSVLIAVFLGLLDAGYQYALNLFLQR